MREIKFRGLRCDGKGWAYGFLFIARERPGRTAHFIILDDGECNSPVKMVLVTPATVGQFMGLKGKDGVEIWEGDIIKGLDAGYNDHVVYEQNKFILQPQGDDCIYWERCEVIGNIHEKGA